MKLHGLMDFITKQVGTSGVPDRAPDRVITNDDGSQDYGYDDRNGATRYYNQSGKYYADGIGSMDDSEKVDRELANAFMKQRTSVPLNNVKPVMKKLKTCPKCRGTRFITCPECHGSGIEVGYGTCPRCDGDGSIMCLRCDGSGQVDS